MNFLNSTKAWVLILIVGLCLYVLVLKFSAPNEERDRLLEGSDGIAFSSSRRGFGGQNEIKSQSGETPTEEASRKVKDSSDGTAEGAWAALEHTDTTLNARWNLQGDIIGDLAGERGLDFAVDFVIDKVGPGSLRANLVAIAFAYSNDEAKVLVDQLEALEASGDRKLASKSLCSDHEIPLEVFAERKSLSTEGVQAFGGSVLNSIYKSEEPIQAYEDAMLQWMTVPVSDVVKADGGDLIMEGLVDTHPVIARRFLKEFGSEYLSPEKIAQYSKEISDNISGK